MPLNFDDFQKQEIKFDILSFINNMIRTDKKITIDISLLKAISSIISPVKVAKITPIAIHGIS